MRATSFPEPIQVKAPEGTQEAVLKASNGEGPIASKKPRAGRPSKYSDELVSEICRRLSEGESLRKICERDDMPARSTVNKWLARNKAFADQYARARERQADFYADEMVFLADTADDVNKARLQIDTRKWIAAKLLPKKYNDRMVTEHVAGEGVGLTDVDLAQRLTAILATGREVKGSDTGEDG